MNHKRLRIILTTTAFGILFWAGVTLRDQYQSTIAVPLSVTDIPEGYAVETPIPHSLMLRVRGDGWRLALMSLGGSFRAEIPYPSLRPRRPVITIAELTERLTLPNGIQILDVNPDSIYVRLARMAQKKVPVVLDCTLSFRKDFGQVGKPRLDPDSVTIAGAESVIRTIDAWHTTRVVLENLKAPVDMKIPLEDTLPYLVTPSPSSIRVQIAIEPFAETSFSGLSVEVDSVPAALEVILIPPRIDVIVRGGIRQLQSVGSNDFRASVKYAVIEADTTGLVVPDILSPPGLQIVSEKPDRLHYIVRRRL